MWKEFGVVLRKKESVLQKRLQKEMFPWMPDEPRDGAGIVEA